MQKLGIFILLLFIGIQLKAQQIQRMEPPNWWVGMKNTQLELLVYGEGISHYKPSINSNGVVLSKVIRTENENYLFLNLELKNARPGNFEIQFAKQGKRNNFSYNYELKTRKDNSAKRLGFNSSDAIYLITPDRFANANTKNDINKSLNETTIDRDDDYARHGGDIEGITNHLDYIQDLGFTAIWSTPLLTNDMKKSSYHGYAITDLYQPDPRFGTMAEYKELAKEMQARGMKMVMDHVANHIGLEHWWMQDLPTSDWVNYQDAYLKDALVITNHRRTTNQDAYASKADSDLMSDGWFVSAMPDLNQKNELLATYLIQNSIWWVETLDLGGIRQDTYPYPDKEFMSEWAGAIMQEYPNFSIVGEEWSLNPLLVAYWQTGATNKDGYESNLTSSMDFPMQRLIVEALNEEESWGTGLVKMYEGLANDFAYTKPSDLLIFPDNHDMSRIFTQLNEHVEHTKMALGYQLVLPRIPQIYYGTEILMNDTAKPGDHGLIRTDFPGGWKGDKVNGFTGKGLSKDQKEMQLFLKKVLNYRKNSVAIHQGKTVHFGPKDAVYVLFRIHKDEVVVTILNKNEGAVSLDLDRFQEIQLKGKRLKNIISGKELNWETSLKIDSGITILSTKI